MYTLRNEWKSSKFTDACRYIRTHGYPYEFYGKTYIQLDINQHFYWTMGAPAEETTLINRKRKDFTKGYPPDLAADYDKIYSRKKYLDEDKVLFKKIGDVSDLDVLDIGCGTGLFLQHKRPKTYTGIDPSPWMLQQLQEKSLIDNMEGKYQVFPAYLHSFVGGRYDLVVCLYGSGNYLTEAELLRLPMLLKPGGRCILMLGGTDYTPEIHEQYDMECVYHGDDHKGNYQYGPYHVFDFTTENIPDFLVP